MPKKEKQPKKADPCEGILFEITTAEEMIEQWKKSGRSTQLKQSLEMLEESQRITAEVLNMVIGSV